MQHDDVDAAIFATGLECLIKLVRASTFLRRTAR